MAKNIASLPKSDRPYEKLEINGSENLTNSELLAIIIKSGTKDKNCLDISREILAESEGLYIDEIEYLNSLSLSQLMKFDGIGRKKAIEIRAVCELARRINKNVNSEKKKIHSACDVYNLVSQIYFGLKTEIISVIMLDVRLNVIAINKLSSGLSSNVILGIKEVFSEPIKQMASSIILVHNHPGGSIIPSKDDIKFTKKIEEYGNTFKIKLIDHIIIAKDKYISMKEKGYF